MRYNSTETPGKSAIEKIQALTNIDKATGWLEVVTIRSKTNHHIAPFFDSEWLSAIQNLPELSLTIATNLCAVNSRSC
jgi:hypothetical protein